MECVQICVPKILGKKPITEMLPICTQPKLRCAKTKTKNVKGGLLCPLFFCQDSRGHDYFMTLLPFFFQVRPTRETSQL